MTTTRKPESPRAQVAQMKAIVRKDATATGRIITEDGRMCAIGGLAHYGAGVPQATMQMWRDSNAYDSVTEAWQAACQRFPILSRTTASVVYRINDDNRNLDDRRAALCHFFDSLLTEAKR